jgi:hypothetical protein
MNTQTLVYWPVGGFNTETLRVVSVHRQDVRVIDREGTTYLVDSRCLEVAN